MWKSCIIASSLLFIFSCRQWNDQDLFIPEVFINDHNAALIIIKNQGHDKITQKGIKLKVIWDQDYQFEFLLDTMDPHFRNPRDSSIIKLPVTVNQGRHTVFAQIDVDHVLAESNEDHNYYSRSLLAQTKNTEYSYHSPISNKTFNKELYLDKMQTLPFANQVIWYEGNKPFILSFWQTDWQNALLKHIQAYYQDSFTPIQDTFDTHISREAAFEIYLKYIAHALVLDQENLVPWKVTDFTPEEIGALWKSNNLFSFDSINHLYQWTYESGGGIKVLDPLPVFAFGTSLNSGFTTPREAIYRFLTWTRAYLNHTESSSKIKFQNPEFMLYPLPGEVHRTESCWATSGLLLEYSRALNIPIIRSTITLHNGIHSQFSYPSENIYVTHADDIYDPLFYPIGNPASADDMSLNKVEYRDFMSTPIFCVNDSCHSTGTQHTYDRRRYLITKAFNSQSGKLYQASAINELKSILRGDEFPSLLAPIFSEAESKQIEARLKKSNPNMSMINTLYHRYVDAKNNTR